MNVRQHALLARALIRACGGLDESAGACRLNRSRLSDLQRPDSGAFMPADVMADLEAYCGQPLYSQAIMASRPSADDVAGVVTEACEMSEAAAELQRLVRLAAQDGKLSPSERLDIEEGLNRLEDKARQLRAANDRGAA